MAYAEKRGNLWRARWRGPDGTLESRPGFHTRKAAETGKPQCCHSRGASALLLIPSRSVFMLAA